MAEEQSSDCSTSCYDGEAHLNSSGANGFNKDEDDMEKENFQRILNAFLFYRCLIYMIFDTLKLHGLLLAKQQQRYKNFRYVHEISQVDKIGSMYGACSHKKLN